ncbi:MAG: LytR C-terminal domain-containing protein [Actinomycetota bacterium]
MKTEPRRTPDKLFVIPDAAPSGPPIAAGRSRRRMDARRRRRRTALVALGIAAVVLAAALVVRSGSGGPGGAGDDSGAGGAGRSDLLVLSVSGAPKPMRAVIGGGGPSPSAMAVPIGLTLEAPGRGELTTRRVAELPGESLQVAAANTVGTWVDHYATTDLGRLGALVDRAGGLRVHLSDAVVVGQEVLGPGEVVMDGTQLQVFLALPGVNGFTRWEIVLTALLHDPPELREGDLVETDDLDGVQAVLDRARGARLETMPIVIAAARVRVPDYGELDALMAERFGVKRIPTPVIVQNGVGTPGLGEVVGRLLIPRGFRITLSQNAATFDHETTDIIAILRPSVGAARRAQATLGVGEVTVSRVPSGIGDVMIVVGKDFTA